MSQYVYHFKPKGMTGDRLIPLNDLKAALSETFDLQIKKYEGREKLMKLVIPILDCLWNDVLHFSPINPQIILDTWRNDGLIDFASPKLPIEVYKVPVKLLEESKVVCFQSFNYDFHNFDPESQKFWKFEVSKYQEQEEVEPKQVEIWKNDKRDGRFLMWYSHTMHVLAKQELDIGDCELIVCK